MDFTTQLTPFEMRLFALFILLLLTCVVWFITLSSFDTKTSRLRKRIFLVLSGILGIGFMIMIYSITQQLAQIPGIEKTTPTTHLHPLSPVITVSFKTPIDSRVLNVHTYPEYEFLIEPVPYIHANIPIARTVRIIPQTTLPAGQKIMVYLSNIKGPFTHVHGGEHLIEITPYDPEVIHIDPPMGDTSVLPQQSFSIELSTPSDFESEWSVESNPVHQFSVVQKTESTLIVTPLTPLKQAQQYTFSLFQTPVVIRKKDGEVLFKGEPKNKFMSTFSTVKPAFISQFEPQGIGINPSLPVRITFDTSIHRQSLERSISIHPPVNLRYVWDATSAAVTISHDSFEKDTEYTVTLKQGLENTSGGLLEKDVIFTFKTAGPLTLTHSIPNNNTHNISPLQTFRVFFDQEIDKDAASFFSISPPVKGDSSITNNMFEFIPSEELLYDTAYTLLFKANMTSVYGLPSTKDQSVTFTTSPKETTLSVPFYKQQDQFTCNIAAARMLLAYRGITVEEQTLIDRMGNGGKRGSGNPFNGYIDDYGTYWDAVSKGISSYRTSRLITSGQLEDIITEIKKGNPVMIWGQNGWSDPHDISWTTPDGIFIKAINGMHSFVVRGFRGPPENPTHILINDPWRGQYAVETKEFLRRWGFLSMALVID